jgi:DNA repair photolyase
MARVLQLSLLPELARSPSLRDVADAVKDAGIEGLPSARRRADQARYQEVAVRSAMAKTVGMPFKWALNPYRGCTHACEYCYARKYQRHLEMGTGDDFSSVILVKHNLPEVLQRELARPQWTHEHVAVGTATDPYQPIEGHYRLTRRCLDALIRSRTPFSVVTKGPMVVRDLDLLVEATKHAGCEVYLSVPSVDEDAWSRLEPGTASPRQRIRAVRQMSDAGVETGVLMMPLVPGLTTTRASIERTLRALADAGVRQVGANVARLDPGVKEHFFAFLSREYPHLLDGYRRLYPGAYVSKAYASKVKETVATLKGLVKPGSQEAWKPGS